MDPDGQAIQPLVTYLPVNAHLLESKLEYSKESRRRMLRSVERFSGTRMLYRNKIEMENDEDFHRRLYRTAHLLNVSRFLPSLIHAYRLNYKCNLWFSKSS